MPVSFHPAAGQVAIIAPESERAAHDPANRLIGVVAASDGTLIILGVCSPDLADGTDVVVSIFTSEGLYRIRATAYWVDAGGLAIDPIRDVELVQRRQWPRRPVHLDVIVSPAASNDRAWAGVAGETLDVSVGGLRVATDRRLPPGAELAVTLTLPDGARLVARTRVVYAFVHDDAFEYRLAFDDLADRDATVIEALVARDAAGATWAEPAIH